MNFLKKEGRKELCRKNLKQSVPKGLNKEEVLGVHIGFMNDGVYPFMPKDSHYTNPRPCMYTNLLYEHIQTYAADISSPESELLARLRKETKQLVGSQMLSSPLQGRMLALFSRLLKPTKIVEIGTYTGYATLCLAEGLADGGLVYTLDRNEKVVAVAKRYVAAAGQIKKVRFCIGKALEILPTLPGPFDLVFIDADKKNYARYYDSVIGRVRSGGLIIADNIFWHGKVLEAMCSQQDSRTRALVGFAQKVKADNRVEQVCLPLRDGLVVARKC